MCTWCKESAFGTLIESEKLESAIIGWEAKMKATELDNIDNSVVMEIRCGSGYIRLGDRGDMNCLDHEEKIEINYCPMCGRKLGNQ